MKRITGKYVTHVVGQVQNQYIIIPIKQPKSQPVQKKEQNKELVIPVEES